MLSLSKPGYTDKEIMDKLHLADGTRNVKYRYDLLNKQEIKIGELDAISGNIGLSSLAQIKRRGSFNFKENELKDVDWLNDRVQPFFMLQMNDGNWIEYPLGIYLMSSPTRNIRSNGVYRQVEVYDTSLALLEDKLTKRTMFASGTRYTSVITRLLNNIGIWKVNIPSYFGRLNTDKEFEIGISILEIVNDLLKEINYTSVWMDENGYITANRYEMPDNREAEYSYRNDELSIMHKDTAIEEKDLFSIPNHFVVVATNPEEEPLVSRYSNTRKSSITSIPSRGRTIVDHREVDSIANQESLDEYVKRIAYEASNTYGKFMFKTATMPHHSYLDCLFCEHTGLDISNKYIETSWEMELVEGGTMSHTARRVIQL